MAETTTNNSGDATGGEPVQLYRFKVRTADGREMTSAVAVVDPNAEGDTQHDAATEKEDLEAKHKAEDKAHDEELSKIHDEHAADHEAAVDAQHEELTAKHEEAIDAKHEGELAKTEAEHKEKTAE